MGFSRCQKVNAYYYFIIRRFYNTKVRGAKTQDIIPFWPYKQYSLSQWLALLHFGTLHFDILDFVTFQFGTMRFSIKKYCLSTVFQKKTRKTFQNYSHFLEKDCTGL
jgi:hypothetical protein